MRLRGDETVDQPASMLLTQPDREQPVGMLLKADYSFQQLARYSSRALVSTAEREVALASVRYTPQRYTIAFTT